LAPYDRHTIDEETSMKLTGRCYCGDIQYEFEGEAQGALQCHCRECQYITGGNPNVIMVLPESGFKFTRGAPASFARSDLERPVTRYFCAHCGTGMGTRSPARPGSFILKVGTLDDPGPHAPGLHVFTRSRIDWVEIPSGVPQFAESPG